MKHYQTRFPKNMHKRELTLLNSRVRTGLSKQEIDLADEILQHWQGHLSIRKMSGNGCQALMKVEKENKFVHLSPASNPRVQDCWLPIGDLHNSLKSKFVLTIIYHKQKRYDAQIVPFGQLATAIIWAVALCNKKRWHRWMLLCDNLPVYGRDHGAIYAQDTLVLNSWYQEIFRINPLANETRKTNFDGFPTEYNRKIDPETRKRKRPASNHGYLKGLREAVNNPHQTVTRENVPGIEKFAVMKNCEPLPKQATIKPQSKINVVKFLTSKFACTQAAMRTGK